MTLGKRTDYGDSKFAGLEVAFPADGLDKVVQARASAAQQQHQEQLEHAARPAGFNLHRGPWAHAHAAAARTSRLLHARWPMLVPHC